jgi:hypothetical protein
MCTEQFRFKMTSYEDPELCFGISYDGNLIQISSFDEHGHPCKYGYKVDPVTFSNLQKEMQPHLEQLKNEPASMNDEHVLYWSVKNEVDGISISCDGHIEKPNNAKEKKNLILNQIRTQSPVLSC